MRASYFGQFSDIQSAMVYIHTYIFIARYQSSADNFLKITTIFFKKQAVSFCLPSTVKCNNHLCILLIQSHSCSFQTFVVTSCDQRFYYVNIKAPVSCESSLAFR